MVDKYSQLRYVVQDRCLVSWGTNKLILTKSKHTRFTSSSAGFSFHCHTRI